MDLQLFGNFPSVRFLISPFRVMLYLQFLTSKKIYVKTPVSIRMENFYSEGKMS